MNVVHLEMKYWALPNVKYSASRNVKYRPKADVKYILRICVSYCASHGIFAGGKYVM